jgi:hypothetical protein
MIGVLLAYLLVLLAGFGAAALLAGRTRLRWTEYAALSWLIGAGVISLATWLLGMALSGWALRGGLAGLALALGGLGWRAFRATTPIRSASRWPDFGLFVVLGALVGYAAWFAPQVALGWDSLMIWEAKSFLAFQFGGTIPPSYYSSSSLLHTWPFYPLYLPYLQAWVYGWAGAPDQGTFAAFPALFLASTALLLHATLRRQDAPRWLANAAMAGLAAIPYGFSGAWGMFTGYADFTLAALFFAAVWAAVWCHASRAPAALRLLAVIAALLPWLKREGQYLWLAILLVPLWLLFRERRWRSMAQLVAPGVTLIVGWTSYLKFHEVLIDPTFARMPLATMAERFGPVVGRMGSELLARDHWGCLWVATAVALVVLLFTRQWGLVSILACAMILPMGIAVFAYLCSTWASVLHHVLLSFQRLALQVSPVAILAIALACPWPADDAPEAEASPPP